MRAILASCPEFPSESHIRPALTEWSQRSLAGGFVQAHTLTRTCVFDSLRPNETDKESRVAKKRVSKKKAVPAAEAAAPAMPAQVMPQAGMGGEIGRAHV